MMATTAIHKLGDISRDEPDLAYITGEDGDDWIGNWVTGYGYIHVRFPKSSTRELTAAERGLYDEKTLTLAGEPVGRIEVCPVSRAVFDEDPAAYDPDGTGDAWNRFYDDLPPSTASHRKPNPLAGDS
jgi:hypothetical protein